MRLARQDLHSLTAHLKRVPDIGNFAFCINLTESPVMGGIHLHELQQQVADIPLWRDQIPELSIKVMKDGRQQRFYLVSRGTTVKISRGKPISIPVEETFTLPDSKMYYSFPLYIGDNANDLEFLCTSRFLCIPIEKKVECELSLTFEYGADDPYKLVFTPRDKSFPAHPRYLAAHGRNHHHRCPRAGIPNSVDLGGVTKFPRHQEWRDDGLDREVECIKRQLRPVARMER